MADLPSVVRVHGVARHYAWGSTTAIPRLLGDEPDGRPVAELWFGAHEDDPSPVGQGEEHAGEEHAGSDGGEPGSDLAELIAADPAGLLGAQAVARFGPRLPFLAKLLAAGMPLSIQVHPNLTQARAGFAAEDARGVARDAPQRNYRDANHKPELLCALTPFEALCGFRPPERTLALLARLDVAELGEVARLLAGPDGLRAAFVHVLSLPEPRPLIDAVVRACAKVGAEVSAEVSAEVGAEVSAEVATDDPAAGPASAVLRAAAEFPNDVGVVLSLLLNHVRLAPGEAIFLGAGNVHCYLAGLGVEVMANSDNVLRCGLTSKHVDVAELLTITDFTPLAEPRCPVRDVGGAVGGAGVEFEVPVPDFALTALELDASRGGVAVGGTGPYLVLCTAGAVDVAAGGSRVALRPGHGAFVRAQEPAATPAGTPAVTLAGHGRAFVAGVGA